MGPPDPRNANGPLSGRAEAKQLDGGSGDTTIPRPRRPRSDTLLTCESCRRPAPLIYTIDQPWLVAACCATCESDFRRWAA